MPLQVLQGPLLPVGLRDQCMLLLQLDRIGCSAEVTAQALTPSCDQVLLVLWEVVAGFAGVPSFPAVIQSTV
jgi:hypothetical protein